MVFRAPPRVGKGCGEEERHLDMFSSLFSFGVTYTLRKAPSFINQRVEEELNVRVLPETA